MSVLARVHTGTRRVDVGALVFTEEGTVLEGRQRGSTSSVLHTFTTVAASKQMTVSVKATLLAQRPDSTRASRELNTSA